MMLEKILEKIFITKKFTQCKTSCTLKIDVIKIPQNKNIVKLFSKYEPLFSDQANSSFDRSQILILQFAMPSAFLSSSLSKFPPNFTLANWKPYSTQFSSCFSSVSVFCLNLFDHMSPQVFDISNHMPSQSSLL